MALTGDLFRLLDQTRSHSLYCSSGHGSQITFTSTQHNLLSEMSTNARLRLGPLSTKQTYRHSPNVAQGSETDDVNTSRIRVSQSVTIPVATFPSVAQRSCVRGVLAFRPPYGTVGIKALAPSPHLSSPPASPSPKHIHTHICVPPASFSKPQRQHQHQRQSPDLLQVRDPSASSPACPPPVSRPPLHRHRPLPPSRHLEARAESKMQRA